MSVAGGAAEAGEVLAAGDDAVGDEAGEEFAARRR